MSDIREMSDVVIGCRISDFGDISGPSSKFRTSRQITNIYSKCLKKCNFNIFIKIIHTQLMQNYINMFRIGILNLNILHIFANSLLKFLN